MLKIILWAGFLFSPYNLVEWTTGVAIAMGCQALPNINISAKESIYKITKEDD